jgi:hypothetical protein
MLSSLITTPKTIKISTMQMFLIAHHLNHERAAGEFSFDLLPGNKIHYRSDEHWVGLCKLLVFYIDLYSFIGFSSLCMLFLFTMSAKNGAKQRGCVPSWLRHTFIFWIIQMTLWLGSPNHQYFLEVRNEPVPPYGYFFTIKNHAKRFGVGQNWANDILEPMAAPDSVWTDWFPIRARTLRSNSLTKLGRLPHVQCLLIHLIVRVSLLRKCFGWWCTNCIETTMPGAAEIVDRLEAPTSTCSIIWSS